MDNDHDQLKSPRWIHDKLQVWLDSRLAGSTAARNSLKELHGRSFELVLTGIDIHTVFHVDGERMTLASRSADDVDARLIASPMDALQLARGQSLSVLKQTNARLEGNIHIAEGFSQTFAFLSPDLEAELAEWIGDVGAHELASAGYALFGFLRRAATAFEENTSEFLKEEQPMLARPREVSGFIEDIDEVRDAVERAASRVSALELMVEARSKAPQSQARPAPGNE
jgi:ubiquinone biosynthesis protein UbiJ